MPSENSPLLTPNNYNQDTMELSEPSFITSIKNLLFGSYVNILLVAVPLSFISHFLKFGKSRKHRDKAGYEER